MVNRVGDNMNKNTKTVNCAFRAWDDPDPDGPNDDILSCKKLGSGSPRPKTIWAKDASAQTMGTLYETSAIYNHAMVCYKKVQVSAKQRSSDLLLRKQLQLLIRNSENQNGVSIFWLHEF